MSLIVLMCCQTKTSTFVNVDAMHWMGWDAICTVDVDVVVVALSMFHKLNVNELWVAFGTGKSYCYICIHETANAMGTVKCTSILAFHSIVGCDTISSFRGRGKKTAWDI